MGHREEAQIALGQAKSAASESPVKLEALAKAQAEALLAIQGVLEDIYAEVSAIREGVDDLRIS